MDLNEYQQEADQTAVYINKGEIGGLVYTILGAVGEAGELANKVKKVLRDSDGIVTEDRRQALSAELGDVLWYVAAVATELGIPLSVIAQQNLAKLSARKVEGTLHGDGDTVRTLPKGKVYDKTEEWDFSGRGRQIFQGKDGRFHVDEGKEIDMGSTDTQSPDEGNMEPKFKVGDYVRNGTQGTQVLIHDIDPHRSELGYRYQVSHSGRLEEAYWIFESGLHPA